MKKVFILLMLAVLFAPLAMNAQRSIVKQKDVDLFSMPRISLSELNSKGGDRATNTLLTEGFESVTMYENQYSATDWFTYNAGSGNNWDLYQGYAHGGSMCMSYEYVRRYAADCYFVSEPFSVSASMTELSVSLWERVLSTSYPETFEVFFVRANQVTDLASVVSANHYMAIASASYTNTSYAQVSGNTTITALAGQSVRLVVHCTSAANMYRLMIDDITITEITNDSSCGIAPLPHFNGFENEAQYGCWTYSGLDVSLSTSNPRTGSYCLKLNGLDDDHDQFLISPEFDGESAMEMSFYYRIADQDRDQFFYLGWGPDLSHLSFDPIEIAHNLSYQEYTEVFPKGTKYIVIAVYGRTGTSSDPSYMLLDDITINGGCIKPRGLEADNVTTRTVDLTWGDYSDNGYNVAYRTKTIASATLANTRFEDKFNSNYLNTSNWPNIQNQLYSSDATDWGIRSISGVEAYTGNYYASSRSYDGEEDHSVRNWLISKTMTLGNVVKFYMNENYPSWLDHVDVCVGTDNLTFVVVAQPTVSSAGWEEVTIDLSKYAGQTGFVAIVHEDADKDYVAIDDFGVYTYNYTYTYGPWQYTTARSNSVTLTGLMAETTYEVMVQSICGENETSDWSTAIDFTTPSACTAPIDLTADDITPNSATLSWSNYQDSYNVRYRGQIFYESFDRGVPSDWTTINQADNGYDWMQWPGQDGTTGVASPSYINNVGNLTPDNWLITPQIDLGGYLEMWVTGWDKTDFYEHFAVYVSTAGNGVSDFTATTPLLEETTETTATYQRRVIDLTSYAGQQGYIAIRHFGCTGQYRFCVENFGIYKTEDWLTVSPNEATTTLTGLLFNTEYVWQVQGAGCDTWSAPAYFTVPEGYIKHIDKYTSSGNGYYLIASPIGEVAPANVTNMLTNTYDLYYFKQDNFDSEVDNRYEEWMNYRDSNFGLEPGKGYLYANSETVDLIFYGSAHNTNNVQVTLAYDENANLKGKNLVGNPYAVDAYINKPFYIMNETGSDFSSQSAGTAIAPMTGVFVTAEQDGETLTFTTTRGSKSPELALNLSDGRYVIDRAIVSFGQGQQLPKFQLNRNHTKVYIPQNGEDYAVVSSEEMGEMPINFEAENNGTYSLILSSENTEFAYLHLIDNMTGADVDLLQTPSYSFEAKTTDYASRFKLVFATGDNSNSETFAFFSNGSFVINNEGDATLQVIDVMGRIIKSESINGCASVNVNAAPGVYMLRLVNGANVKVQKVIVK